MKIFIGIGTFQRFPGILKRAMDGWMDGCCSLVLLVCEPTDSDYLVARGGEERAGIDAITKVEYCADREKEGSTLNNKWMRFETICFTV